MRRLIMVLTLLTIAILTCTYVGAQSRQFISIATATQAGTYYAIGNILASVFNKYIPGITFTAQATAGAAQNVELLRKKEVDLILCLDFVAEDAYSGRGTWADKEKATWLRSVAFVGTWVDHILAREGSGIKSIADLRGKRVSVGAAGSGVEETNRKILEVHGLDYRNRTDFRPAYLGIAETTEQLRNGQIDAAMYTGSLPTSSVIESLTSGKVYLVPVSLEMGKKMHEKYPAFFLGVIPRGTYPNQTEDVPQICTASFLMTRSDMPAETVEKIVRVMYEHLDELYAAYANFREITKETIVQSSTVPRHPGAERYFREAGLLK